jgi:DNA repair photolyase
MQIPKIRRIQKMKLKQKTNKNFGTKEWSTKTVNCCDGCSHDCLYCYAKGMAVDRFHRLTENQWSEEKVRHKDIDKNYPLYNGRVMFPSSHDITPTNFYACWIVLDKLLNSGNEVLIVSKPHLECITKLCGSFKGFKNKIKFRFTIGSTNNDILSFWEPNAPSYEERIDCLKHSYEKGFKTSVSIEPILGNIKDTLSLIDNIYPYAETIWIGAMNHLNYVAKKIDREGLCDELSKIGYGQGFDNIVAKQQLNAIIEEFNEEDFLLN